MKMKITYSVYVDKNCNHNVERTIDAADYEGVLRGINDVLDLYELRCENARRDASNREAKRRAAAPVSLPQDPPRDDGPHENVYEYDGAYKCLTCEKTWGAISGSPRTAPAVCDREQCVSELNPRIRCTLVATHSGLHQMGKPHDKGFVQWDWRSCICDGQDPAHVQCFQGNDPVGKLKAAGEDRS